MSVAQFVECLPFIKSIYKNPWVLFLAPDKTWHGVRCLSCCPKTVDLEVLRAKDYSQVHNKFKVSLGYIKLCLSKKEIRKTCKYMNSKFIAIFLKHLEKNKVKIMYEQL